MAGTPARGAEPQPHPEISRLGWTVRGLQGPGGVVTQSQAWKSGRARPEADRAQWEPGSGLEGGEWAGSIQVGG